MTLDGAKNQSHLLRIAPTKKQFLITQAINDLREKYAYVLTFIIIYVITLIRFQRFLYYQGHKDF